MRKYARLLEVSQKLGSTLDLKALLDGIVDAARELTESEAASLLLYDSQTNHLHFEAATGNLIEGARRAAVPVDNSIAGWVFSHSEPLVVHDVLKDPRFFREMDVLNRYQTQTILGVPLRAKENAFGVIEAVNKVRGHFDDDDVQVLQTLAAQAAIAIENSRLFQQSDLIAEIVHELRTPLASLTAASHMLQRPDLSEEQRSQISQTVYGEVGRLNDMASDFLELSRLESGRAQFTREPVHLGGLIGECIEIVRPQADQAGIELDSDLDLSLAPVAGDRNRLKQVFLNLLTNAIKYNKPAGMVEISLERNETEILAHVRDTGRGIPIESLPHIFERFYRVPDLESHASGTGLGLAIAKRILEAHQGALEVRSKIGEGSTFTVVLPVTSPGGYETRPPL